MSKELAATLAEIERRQKEEHFRFIKPFAKQRLFHLSGKRNSWALGGNRTGKTEGGALKAVILALGDTALKYMVDWPDEIRQAYQPLVKRFDGKPTRGWIGSVSFEVQRDVTQKKLLGDAETGMPGLLPVREIKKITNRISGVIDIIQLKNGSTIGFKSYDQGREKFQGTSQHWIWLDEEPPKDIYTECQMRVMDTQGDIWGTMTPLSGLTWVYDDIYLNDSKPINKQDKEVYCIMMEWKDNPYLSEDEQQRLEASMDPNQLEARKHGRFIMPGKCTFDAKAVSEGLERSYPGERGNLTWADASKTKVAWEPDEAGEYEIWFHPDATNEYEFLMAADIAEGLEHGDFDAVGVLNRDAVRIDAVYHGKVDADVLADYIHRLAVYYRNPIVAPEGNNHGLTTISHLKGVYSDIYRSTVYDKTADKELQKLGWYTTVKTRPLAVDAIKRAVRERQLTCYWRRFWDEAMNFIRHPSGKEAARSGYWDDTVIMLGILIHIHNTTAITKSMPSPSVPGGIDKRAGWQLDAQGNEIFIHPSRIEDELRKSWGEEEW